MFLCSQVMSQEPDFIFRRDGKITECSIRNWGTKYIHWMDVKVETQSTPLSEVGGFLRTSVEYEVKLDRPVRIAEHTTPPDMFHLSLKYKDRFPHHLDIPDFNTKLPGLGYDDMRTGGYLVMTGGLLLVATTIMSMVRYPPYAAMVVLSAGSALSFTIGGAFVVGGSIKNRKFHKYMYSK